MFFIEIIGIAEREWFFLCIKKSFICSCFTGIKRRTQGFYYKYSVSFIITLKSQELYLWVNSLNKINRKCEHCDMWIDPQFQFKYTCYGWLSYDIVIFTQYFKLSCLEWYFFFLVTLTLFIYMNYGICLLQWQLQFVSLHVFTVKIQKTYHSRFIFKFRLIMWFALYFDDSGLFQSWR